MSEYQPLPHQPIEDDAVAVIKVNESIEFTATRNNTLLSTYLGRAAFNNILIWDEQKAMRLFEEAPDYEQLEEFIQNNDFPMILNQTTVPAEVQEMYVKTVMESTPDTMPEDW